MAVTPKGVVLLIVFWLALTGCARHEVRHLASDACLLVPGETREQELLGLLGAPDYTRPDSDGGQVWYYIQGNKSLLRKTPYIGDKLGREDFDLLVVTLGESGVRSCVYRSLSEDEYRQLQLDANSKVGQSGE